ncbi:MAG: (E)-4-hydroxy-3-methylbut-2-enyl-diphosphate synthase, partial [Muribaculaceae bacterium]|nr:(E)-4-hydroxy-3-methylbut-2-enyl-diphosphate synthase [Muribaculaceae bacterium]
MPSFVQSPIINLKNKSVARQIQTLRRITGQVHIGDVVIGSPAPVVLQSMTTTATLDTKASAAQVCSLAAAGAQLVRLTAQGVTHATNLAFIKDEVRRAAVDVPLVADIHFNPAAAFEAAKHVEKVRINPGNFFDPGRTFRKMVFTDEEYDAELARIREKFTPFLQLCRQNNTAIRIGVNHGSLSDRIMSRFGDGAEGMVESALEYLRICQSEHFDSVVVSIKASDVPLMTDTVRLLAESMEREDMHYPLHLGVTEAGDALEGRIKSAVGIGSLLIDGIGDTIRVSLSEAPENEIPVARMLADHCMNELEASAKLGGPRRQRSTGRRKTTEICGIGANLPTSIVGKDIEPDSMPADCRLRVTEAPRVATVRAKLADSNAPTAIVLSYPEIANREELIIAASANLGALLLDGYQDAIGIESPLLSREEAAGLCEKIIQAAGIARFQAEIVACPGCGRTLFDLPEALGRVKEACMHLKHLKIAVMGCIVNGPGEMAGADYGYVGAAAGNVSIYRGIECIYKNIAQDEALDTLISLI